METVRAVEWGDTILKIGLRFNSRGGNLTEGGTSSLEPTLSLITLRTGDQRDPG